MAFCNYFLHLLRHIPQVNSGTNGLNTKISLFSIPKTSYAKSTRPKIQTQKNNGYSMPDKAVFFKLKNTKYSQRSQLLVYKISKNQLCILYQQYNTCNINSCVCNDFYQKIKDDFNFQKK